MKTKKLIQIQMNAEEIEMLVSNHVSELMSNSGYRLTLSENQGSHGFPDYVYLGECIDGVEGK